MGRPCSVLGCNKTNTASFRIPVVSKSKSVRHIKGGICTLAQLSKERQEKWLKILKIGPSSQIEITDLRICSDHFISGKPADLIDRDSQDWVPCRKLGYTSKRNDSEKKDKEIVSSFGTSANSESEILFKNGESIENSKSPRLSKHSPAIETQNSKSISSLDNLIDFTSESQQNKLHKLIARAIYSTASPMDMTENHHWKQFFKGIQPSYTLPTAHELRGSLLINEYNLVMEAVQERIRKVSFLVLVTYGWTNPNGEIHFVIMTTEPIFFKCLLSKSERDNIYISQQIMEVIEEIGSEKMMFLLTDGGPKMKEAWKIIEKTYPQVLFSVSAADDMKVLLKDIIKLQTVQEILTKAKEMLLSINLVEADVEENEEHVKIPIFILKSILDNKSAFQVDIAPDEMIPEEVRQKILNEDKEFWIETERLLSLFNDVSEGINTLESNKALLSDIPNVFDGIQKKLLFWVKKCPILSKKEKNEILSSISVSKESVIQPIHFAANLLDPRYKGRNLKSEELASAVDFMKQQCEYLGYNESNVLMNLEEYRNLKGSFTRSFLWGTVKHISPVEWWRNFCASQALSRLAVPILSVPPSPVIYQKMFEGIEMNLRHGLNLEDLGKLITIKSNLILTKVQVNKL